MATDPVKAVEVFSAPIQGVIAALGRGIADAQLALDRGAVQAQEEIDADPVLAGLGMQATWYQLPRVELELKLALAISEEREGSAPPLDVPGAAPVGPLRPLAFLKPVKLIAQPVSASFQNRFNYDVNAASTIKLTIVPVPPAAQGAQAVAPANLTPEKVQELALQSSAGFKTVTLSDQTVAPDPKLRFGVNFNSGARTWYVLQHDPADASAKAVVVAIDDVTSVVRVIQT
jgi:hypothetical protein